MFIVSAILIAITVLLVRIRWESESIRLEFFILKLINVILVIFFIAMIQKEKALFNAKQKYTQNKDGYRTLEDDESAN